MINNLLFEFKAILSESNWIDPVSKMHAMEKVKKIKIQIKFSIKFLRLIQWTLK